MPWDFLSLLSFTQILKRCISWRCFHLDCIYCILQRGCKESVPGCWLVLVLSCYFWSWRSLNIHMSFDLWKLQERCWNWLGRNLYEVTKWISTFSFCPALNEAFCGSLGESIIVQSSIVPTPTLCNKFYYLSCLFFFRWSAIECLPVPPSQSHKPPSILAEHSSEMTVSSQLPRLSHMKEDIKPVKDGVL